MIFVCLIVYNYDCYYYLITTIHNNKESVLMDPQGLVVKKGLKGKQNKKMWKKNIDVSGLMQKIQNQQIQQTRRKYAKPLIVEDTTQNIRNELDPNRFKKRVKSQPKKIYDNSFKRANLLDDGMEDVWTTSAQQNKKKSQQLIVPAMIKPVSGHSYNPKKQDVQAIIDEVIDYEKPRPRKERKIKKIQDKKVIKRTRNKKLRQQFLMARQRKMQKLTIAQLHSAKKIKKQIQQKQKKIQQKIQTKQKQRDLKLQQYKTGKVRQGPKIGKLTYKYKQYIPTEDEVNKKISHVSQSNQLIKQQYDNIFRRGIFQPRSVKVQRNRRKNIKVKAKFQEDQ